MGEPSHSSDRVTLLPCEMTRQNLADNPNAKLRMLYIASAFCVICMIIKIVGGWLAHSLVIASGAFHLLSVVCALLISIVAICKTQRQPTDDQSFGYHRAEVLGDFASIIVIWFVTGIIIYLAVKRLLQGDIKIDSNIMMITGIVGAVANGFLLAILRGIGRSSNTHAHSPATHPLHDNTGINNFNVEAARESDLVQSLPAQSSSTKVRAITLHVISDFFSNVGIFVASIIIMFKPEWTFVDPACTLLFRLFSFVITIPITSNLITVLMEGLVKNSPFQRNKIEDQVSEIPGIVNLHNVRAWSYTLDKSILNMHVIIHRGYDPYEIRAMVDQKMQAMGELWDRTIQVEPHVLAENEICEECEDTDLSD